jgi:hypothetical protein
MTDTLNVGGVKPFPAPASPEDAQRLQKELDQQAVEVSIEKAVKGLRQDIRSGRGSQSHAMAISLSQAAAGIREDFEAEIAIKERGGVKRNGSLSLAACKALPPEVVVSLALSYTSDRIGYNTGKGKPTTVAGLAGYLAKVISTEIMARGTEGAAKAFLERFNENSRRKGTLPLHQVTRVHDQLVRLGLHGLAPEDAQPFGQVLIAAMIENGVLEKYRPLKLSSSKKAPPYCVRIPTPLIEAMERLAEGIGAHKATCRPRIVPPFTLERCDSRYSINAGYKHRKFLSGRARYCGVPNLSAEEAPVFFKAANRLQSVRYKVNTQLLKAILEVQQKGGRAFDQLLLTLPRAVGEDLPSLRADACEDEILERKKAISAEYDARHAQRKAVRAAQRLLDTAIEFSDQPSLYLPVLTDFRGRLYYRSDLAPTSGDMARGLLMFADGKPLGPKGAEALSFHLSACAGFDKEPIEFRNQWAFHNSEKICRTAEDPLNNRDWLEADKPYQYLAACFEWAGYVEHGEQYVSGLLVGVDATCSGLQHLAAIRRDPVTAKAVNLRGGDLSDVYVQVGDAFVEKLHEAACGDLEGTTAGKPKTRTEDFEEHLYKRRQAMITAMGVHEILRNDPKLLRKVAKPASMTLVYGVTTRGIEQSLMPFIRDQFSECIGAPGLEDLPAVRMLAELLERAAVEVIPGAMETLKFFKDYSGNLAAQGVPLAYDTPTGFQLHQEYRRASKDTKQVTARCASTKLRIRFAVDYSDELAVGKAKNSAGANIVHSLDASHLAMTVAAFDAPVATIHDDFRCCPADLETLQATLREQFVKLYEGRDVMQELMDQAMSKPEVDADMLPTPPGLGEWDVSEVLDAPYCFS